MRGIAGKQQRAHVSSGNGRQQGWSQADVEFIGIGEAILMGNWRLHIRLDEHAEPTRRDKPGSSVRLSGPEWTGEALSRKRRATPDVSLEALPPVPMKRNARDAIHGDLARILDPSYAPASANLPPTAYVDRHGYLHDPDYRHFPAISPPPSHPSSDDDDAVPVDNDFYAHISNAYDRAGNAYVHPRKRYDQYSYIYASYRSPYHYFTTPATASSSSPPTSFESDATVFDEADDSAFLDDSHSHVNTLKRKLGKRRSSSSQSSTCSPSRKRRSDDRRSSSSTVVETSPRVSVEEPPQRRLSPHEELDEHYLSSHTPPPNHDFDRSDHQSHLESEKLDHQEWTPTCTQNLRRQWQAISLRVRFSVFRAQRRVKRRMQDLI